MKTQKQANAVKAMVDNFSSAVKISKVNDVRVEYDGSSYDVVIEPSSETSVQWLIKTLKQDFHGFAPLLVFEHDGQIIIS